MNDEWASSEQWLNRMLRGRRSRTKMDRALTPSCHSARRILAHLLDKSSTRVDGGTAFETARRLTSKNLPGTGGHDMRISSIFFSPRAACLAAVRR